MDVEPPWRRELVFDHAFVLVHDLEAADARLRAEFGLGTVAGGTFPDHAGLVNRSIPTGMNGSSTVRGTRSHR